MLGCRIISECLGVGSLIRTGVVLQCVKGDMEVWANDMVKKAFK
jgi:hypothetical protein